MNLPSQKPLAHREAFWMVTRDKVLITPPNAPSFPNTHASSPSSTSPYIPRWCWGDPPAPTSQQQHPGPACQTQLHSTNTKLTSFHPNGLSNSGKGEQREPHAAQAALRCLQKTCARGFARKLNFLSAKAQKYRLNPEQISQRRRHFPCDGALGAWRSSTSPGDKLAVCGRRAARRSPSRPATKQASRTRPLIPAQMAHTATGPGLHQAANARLD